MRPEKMALPQLDTVGELLLGLSNESREPNCTRLGKRLSSYPGMAELNLLEKHLAELEREIIQIVEHSREGKILTLITGIGPMAAAMLIAAIGTIANFERTG